MTSASTLPATDPPTYLETEPATQPRALADQFAELKPVQIGPHQLKNPVLLAPMAGVTDLPFRELCLELGAGMAVAEMLSADLSLKDSRKSQFRRRQGAHEGIRSIQIVGSEPDQLAAAARFNADAGADVIDINMGCPAKKVCKKAAGSALLADEQRVADILTAVVGAVDIPVTLKIRTGVAPERRNGVAIAKIAEDCGVQLLTVHGRTRADRFKGQAEYDTIAQIVQAVSIPVIANGDITSAAKAQAVLECTGAAGVMIGRAAQGQPWLPGMIAQALASGLSVNPPLISEQFALISRHLNALHHFYGEFLGVRIARKHIGWFVDGLPNQCWLSADPEVSLAAATGESVNQALKGWKSGFNTLETPDQQVASLRALGCAVDEVTDNSLAA